MSTINLHHGDCLPAMREMKDRQFDIAIVDPPYGIDINMNMGRRKMRAKKHIEKEWDAGIPSDEYFDELMRISTHQIIWGGNYFPLPLTRSWIFWDKCLPEGLSFSDGELAWTSIDRNLKKLVVPYTGFRGTEGKIHPTQKPVVLYKQLLQKYAQPSWSIIDTHLGSGSIAIACHDLDFDLTAYEIDVDYFNAASTRLRNHQLQGQTKNWLPNE